MYLYCKRWIKFIFILPTFLIFLTFTLFPIIDIFITSFKNKTHYVDYGFVGIDNWVTLLADDSFIRAFTNTIIVVVGELIVLLPLAILLGFFLYSTFKLNEVVKVAVFMPYILSGIMVAIVWSFILDPKTGLVNATLDATGLGFLAQKWIGGEFLTPYSVVLVDSWKAVGFFGVLFLTGLKMIPKDTFEAAVIDGANKIQQTVYVTLPLLKETIKIAAVMIVIGAFQSFQTIKILTDGGPNNLSQVLTSYLYRLNFRTFDFGQGSVLSVILFSVIMSISIGILAFSNRRVGE